MQTSRDPRRLAYDLGRAFAERQQLADLLPFAVAVGRELLDAQGVGLLFLDAEHNELYFPYVAEDDPAVTLRLRSVRFPATRGVAGAVLRSGVPERVDDVAHDPRFFGGVDHISGLTTRALMCAPLIGREAMLGVIEVINPLRAEHFTDADLGLLETLAQSLSQAIETSRQRPPVAPPKVASAVAGRIERIGPRRWRVAFGDQTVDLRDGKGLRYIVRLLRYPERDMHVLELASAEVLGGTPAERLPAVGRNSGLAALDTKAKAAYRKRLQELQTELEEAERFNDPGRVARARHDLEFIGRELAAAVGLRGRDRPQGADAERARWAVTKRIKDTITQIERDHPALARHLRAHIRTGYFCTYRPDADHPVDWQF